MEEENQEIPEDILLRLKHNFKDESDYKEALELINHVKNDTLNVGWVQLSRAIILIANGDLTEMKAIIESNYYGDPRDVIMSMMSLKGNSNHYGMTPFEK